MARDIEEFLRKAAERRAAQQKGQRPATPPPAAARPARPVPAEDVTDLAEEPDPFPSGQSVAEHVRQHIDSGAAEISQHTKQLGHEVGEAGQKAKQRIQQNLRHEVGQLGGGQGKKRSQGKSGQKSERQAVPQTAAAQPKQPLNLPPENTPPVLTSVGLGQLLRSPQSIRQAIIVAELLKRPEWD